MMLATVFLHYIHLLLASCLFGGQLFGVGQVGRAERSRTVEWQFFVGSVTMLNTLHRTHTV